MQMSKELELGPMPLGGTPSDTVCDWAEATRFNKNVALKQEAGRAWSKLLLGRKDKPESLEDVMPKSDIVKRAQIYNARIRVDCVAMLVFRLAHVRV